MKQTYWEFVAQVKIRIEELEKLTDNPFTKNKWLVEDLLKFNRDILAFLLNKERD